MSICTALTMPGSLRIDPHHPLAAFVEEAYETFAPSPARTGGHRTVAAPVSSMAGPAARAMRDLSAQGIVDRLRAIPAKDLDFEAVAPFVPRQLELLCMDRVVSGESEEMALAHLPTTGFPHAWPPMCADFLRRFAHAWLATRIGNGSPLLDECLCTISNAGFHVGEFLDDLWALPTPELADCLYRAWFIGGRGRIRQTALWERQSERCRAWGWYVAPDMKFRMMETGLAGHWQAAQVADLIRATLRGPGA